MQNNLIQIRKLNFEDRRSSNEISSNIENKLIQKRKNLIKQCLFDLRLKDSKKLLREKEINLEHMPLEFQNFQIKEFVKLKKFN